MDRPRRAHARSVRRPEDEVGVGARTKDLPPGRRGLAIAAIPIAYAVGAGHAAPLPLTTQSVDEIFLTAAQSLFGTVVLLTRRFRLRDALLLTALFLVQFAIPVEAVHVVIGWSYIGLAVANAVVYRREIVEADVLGSLRTVHLVRRLRRSEMFQIVQTAPTTLRVRLRLAAGADPDRVWEAVQSEMARLLAARGLANVAVERAAEPPEQSPGGKDREVIPLG